MSNAKPILGEDTIFGRRYYRDEDYAALETENARLADALDRQSVITGDYIARCQRLADELAITRRVLDRIGQLCTTPDESKERFIRRVQSVIEWEAQAISAKASP